MTYLHAPDNEASARVATAAGFVDLGWSALMLSEPAGPRPDTGGAVRTALRALIRGRRQSIAIATSSAREVTLSLVNTLRRWKSMVRGLRYSWAAASRLDMPCRTSRAT